MSRAPRRPPFGDIPANRPAPGPGPSARPDLADVDFGDEDDEAGAEAEAPGPAEKPKAPPGRIIRELHWRVFDASGRLTGHFFADDRTHDGKWTIGARKAALVEEVYGTVVSRRVAIRLMNVAAQAREAITRCPAR